MHPESIKPEGFQAETGEERLAADFPQDRERFVDSGTNAEEVAAAPPQAEPTGPAPEFDTRTLGYWVRDLVISLAIALFIITFLYQPVRVEGTSMLPRLEDQDRLFINKLVYHLEKVERDDVVVFHYPLDLNKSYIKRIIALPGDRIRIDNGIVYLNGKQLAEPYVPAKYRDMRSIDEMVVPPNCFFVMGDHRSISSDSRDFGPVARNLIYGKASFVYWPTVDMGAIH